MLNTHNLIINSNPHYLNHTDTDIYKSQNLHTKKHIQTLTFGQQKNVRYKKLNEQ